MSYKFLRKYGEATTINFPLWEVDGVNFRTDATFIEGDVIIMKDEGAEAFTANNPTDEGRGYSLVLTAAESTAKRIVLYVIDQSGTKIWLDDYIIIETYGHADAMHAFNLDYDFSNNVETLKLKQLHIVNSDDAPGIHAESTGGGSSSRGLYAKGGVSGEGIYAEGIEGIEGRGNNGDGAIFTSVSGRGMYISGASGQYALYIAGINKTAVRFEGLGSGIPGGLEIISDNNADALLLAGSGLGSAIKAIGGATGPGAYIKGGSTSGEAIKVETTDGDGINVNASGANRRGVYITGGSSSLCHAVQLAGGNGAGAGLKINGGPTGIGMDIGGGATSGNAINLLTAIGHGLNIVANGTGRDGVRIDSNNSKGIYITAVENAIEAISSNGHGARLRGDIGNGLQISSGFSAGLVSTGSGANPGMHIIGGVSGDGAIFQGGLNSGNGVRMMSQGGNNAGLFCAGDGSGKDIDADELDLIITIDGKVDALATGQGIILIDTGNLLTGQTSILNVIAALNNITVEDIMTAIVDTDIDVRAALQLAHARVNNRYVINPTNGQMTIYTRNNVTVLTVVEVTETTRTRIL